MAIDLDLNKFPGLSADTAAQRLRVDGYNKLPTAEQRGLWHLIKEVVSEPMIGLLLVCGAIYLALGDPQEAVALLFAVFAIIGITFYQEQKTERALAALRDLASPRALVMRGGKPVRVPGREVVCGDVLMLQEGDRVPADGVLLSAINLALDESLLTGESLPVDKSVTGRTLEMARPGRDSEACVFSGTLVVRGHGLAQVWATGVDTEMGKIGKALQVLEPEETALKRETQRLVRYMVTLGLALCVAVVLIYGFMRGDWLHGFLAGIALAMSMLPEEFPVVLTVFLALGAWRIAQNRVLARRATALETMGATTVLCVDKTGTLTQNRMSVQRLYVPGRHHDIEASGEWGLLQTWQDLVETAALASQPEPFDPMEKAIHDLNARYYSNSLIFKENLKIVREYPLAKGLLAVTHVWEDAAGMRRVAAKGAPEAIAELCRYDAQQGLALDREVAVMAEQGLRVLGIAQARADGGELPTDPREFSFEFLGLVGLADPVRPAVPQAIAECYRAGIRVVMITGDYPGTAQQIASRIGLANAEQIITGEELDRLDDSALRQRVRKVNVFARMVPEQKLRLVTALQASGEVVAMTGDGVNDAPALKAAQIGVAMGGRGTDVAREAAALVLLDDDFTSIVRAVRLGRRIYDNLQKAMAYIVAVHVPIAGVAFLPVLMHWPIILEPIHLVFLELVIDPACSIAFEAEREERDIMRRPPRDPHALILNRERIRVSLLQGFWMMLITLAVFAFAWFFNRGETEARAFTFAALVFSNFSLILTNRVRSTDLTHILRGDNKAVWWVIGSATLVLLAVIYLPGPRAIFHFGSLDCLDLSAAFAAGLASFLCFEILKQRRFQMP